MNIPTLSDILAVSLSFFEEQFNGSRFFKIGFNYLPLSGILTGSLSFFAEQFYWIADFSSTVLGFFRHFTFFDGLAVEYSPCMRASRVQLPGGEVYFSEGA
jgi:hypothetical protein